MPSVGNLSTRTIYKSNFYLGLDEYMYWCLDMGMEPLLAVWSGLTLDNTAVSGSALDPYVDDILNELEVGLLIVY